MRLSEWAASAPAGAVTPAILAALGAFLREIFARIEGRRPAGGAGADPGGGSS